MNRAERQFDWKLCAIRSHGRHFNALTNRGALAGRDVPGEAPPVSLAMRGRHDQLGGSRPSTSRFW